MSDTPEQPQEYETTQPDIPSFETTTRDWLRRGAITIAILGAIAGLYFTGRAATTGFDSASENLPGSVDRLIPGSGAQVIRQSQVGIDLKEGYDAYLTINGTEVRTSEDGLITDLGTGLVLVQPGPDKAIETLNEGRNCVVAMVWEQTSTSATAKPVSWCFDAT